MINMKALGKAIQFLFLPTLGLMLIVFFWFFNWGRFINFVTGEDGWSSFLRVFALILEFVSIIILYNYFAKILKDENVRKGIIDDGIFSAKVPFKVSTNNEYIQRAFKEDMVIDGKQYDPYYINYYCFNLETDPDTIIVKRVKK